MIDGLTICAGVAIVIAMMHLDAERAAPDAGDEEATDAEI